jgi:hypothetical protein
MKHVIEHLEFRDDPPEFLDEIDELRNEVARIRNDLERLKAKSRHRELPSRPPGGSALKVSARVRQILPLIAEWIEKALSLAPELGFPESPGIPIAEKLVAIVKKLPSSVQEQRDFLLVHAEALRETGTDNKWPQTAGRQARFVAESLAGCEWGLKPTTSREYIRRQQERRAGGMPNPELGHLGKWWLPPEDRSGE